MGQTVSKQVPKGILCIFCVLTLQVSERLERGVCLLERLCPLEQKHLQSLGRRVTRGRLRDGRRGRRRLQRRRRRRRRRDRRESPGKVRFEDPECENCGR